MNIEHFISSSFIKCSVSLSIPCWGAFFTQTGGANIFTYIGDVKFYAQEGGQTILHR